MLDKAEEASRSAPKRKRRLVGMRRRWIMGSVLPVIVILLLIAALTSVILVTNFYSNARSALESKARSGVSYFNTYVMVSYNEYYRNAVLYAKDFEDADTIELQFLDKNGRIDISSRGQTIGLTPETTEVRRALDGGRMESFSGKDPLTGENILAVSAPLVFDGSVVGVLRLVTATRELDKQVALLTLAFMGIAVVISGVVLAVNLTFMRRIALPVAEVTEAAKRISDGSYGIQIPNKYDDEMGQLVDNINQMSLQISQSEKMHDDEIGELTDAINDMSQKLSQAERVQTEFISSVSHELRTPLTAITGWGETLLADDSGDIGQLHRGVRIILRESRRLTNMVEELLEFSKIEDGRFTLRVEQMDLQAEVEDAIYTYRELFRQDGIDLEYSNAGEMFEQPITGDPERLKQVLCNVLDNAAKHGGSGKRITVSMEQDGEWYVVQVRDYGPGIPEAELPYVKQKFYKGSSKARGSGIGLAVCDEIIRRHEGTFDIGNAPGGGCVVTIRLPISHEEE